MVFDLAAFTPDSPHYRRVHGATGTGSLGVPVAGAADLDGDGFADYALASATASPLGKPGAGLVALVFGDGTTTGVVDTAVPSASILRVAGSVTSEAAGGEVWMDDVTGDGLADLLICRQNYTMGTRAGCGALSVLSGAGLRAAAAGLAILPLAGAAPPGASMFHLVGPGLYDRLGIWARTGDVDGDGVADIVVGADQVDVPGEPDAGAVYVIRGGAHLAESATVDLAGFGSTSLEGRIARLLPTSDATNFHLGATCIVADLDGNGRGEVLMAAALNRSGASINPNGAPAGTAEASGGSPRGTLFVAWDDNFPEGDWPAGFTISMGEPPGSRAILDGGARDLSFGEELIGDVDLDGDGRPDLFVGDLVADGSGTRPGSGLGFVIFDAARMKGRATNIDALVAEGGPGVATILGPQNGAIGSDTAFAGDFDGDGRDDLAVGAPDASPAGRSVAGVVHVFYGRDGAWPAVIDTAPDALPPPEDLRVVEIRGALGTRPNPEGGADIGDILCYSASAGDADGDGRTDLLINEMMGNGVAPAAVDVGNLIVLNGRALLEPEGAPFPVAETLAFLLGLGPSEPRMDANGDGAIDATDLVANPASDAPAASPSASSDARR